MTAGTTLSAAALVLTAVLAVWIARVSALERATFNAFCNEYQVSTAVQEQVVALGRQLNDAEHMTARIVSLLNDRLVACEGAIQTHDSEILIVARYVAGDTVKAERNAKAKPVIFH